MTVPPRVKLPGRCVGCGSDVLWYAKAWRNLSGQHHRCPPDRLR